MEDLKNTESMDQNDFDEHADYELSHTDKLVGIFSEPVSTFKKMAQFDPKTVDWLIPILLVIVVAILSNILMMSNPVIKYAIIEKQMAQVEENLQDMVNNGNMTQEQADQRLERTRDMMENPMGAGMILQVVGIIIVTFITFFIVSGFFLLYAKYGLKGDGNYKTAMVAYGLPYYIYVIQIIVMVILALSMDKFFQNTSVGAFLSLDSSTFGGFLLNKLDVFSIWFYSAVAIGFAKMFKSKSYGKYIGMVFGLWLGFSTFIFLLAQAVPFLKFFVR